MTTEEKVSTMTTSQCPPLWTCKAHVFHIDPVTKKSWLPASSGAVNVSFYFDSSRDLYRIISVEGSKAVINSTITGHMSFTKTSQKFGQWSDLRANTVYGLGFLSEAELNTFIERFNEVKEATRGKSSNNSTSAMSTQQQQANNSLLAPPNLPSSVAADLKSKPRSSDSPPPPYNNNTEGINNNEVSTLDPMLIQSHGAGISTESPSHHNGQPHGGKIHNEQNQLRIENERLRAALAQSSSNAAKWEVELSTLKTNNTRLTAALTESTKNVEQWKRELAQFREANARLRERALEAEARSGDKNAARELQAELHSLRETVEVLRAQSKDAPETKQLEELNVKMGESIAEIVKIQKQMQALLSSSKN